MKAERLLDLQRERFPELPLDCGNRSEPGSPDGEEWRDWSELGTTAPQLRIEDYLGRLGVRGKTILQVGIGASGLAERFAADAAIIVGITIAPREVEKAAALRLRNYQPLLLNKYSNAYDAVPGKFDIIVDDGPTSWCCCLTHLATMLEFYASRLAPRGQFVTDRVGLAWISGASETNPRFGFDFDDLAASARLVGLNAYRAGPDIYILAREAPQRPTLASTASHLLRKVRRKLFRAASLGGRALGT